MEKISVQNATYRMNARVLRSHGSFVRPACPRRMFFHLRDCFADIFYATQAPERHLRCTGVHTRRHITHRANLSSSAQYMSDTRSQVTNKFQNK